MERTYTVYMHTNKINGKIYIGITIMKPSIRWGKDGQNYKGSPYFWAAIQKYGWDNFDHEVIAENLSKDDAAEMECHLIDEKKARDPEHGYNLAAGGYSQPGEENPFYGHHHSEAAKEKVRESNRKRVWTEEAKNGIREKLSGGKSPNAKKVICVETGETYQSVREAATAVNITRGRLIDALQGRHQTCAGFHWKYA